VDIEGLFQLSDDSLTQFVRGWYGPPDRAGVEHLAPDLPSALRTWFALAATYSAPLTTQNVFIEPDRITERDGKSVFWLENQGAYEWAYAAGNRDPLVFERATVDGESWHATDVLLSAFLISVAVFEAIMGAEHQLYLDGISHGSHEALLAPLRPLPMPGPTVDAQLHAGDGLLAFTGPMGASDDNDREWWLYLASLTDAGLGYARAVR
jgi:hypothetical protein